MKMKSTALLVYLALCVASAYQIAHFYPLLPDTVASHFGADGEADGWTAKNRLVVMHIGMLVMLSGTFLGTGVLMRYIPDSLINLPNKDYWLAPERKEQTLRAISNGLTWIGNATLLFVLYIAQRIFQANLPPVQKLNGDISFATNVYMGLILVMTVVLIMRFRRPKSA